MEARKQFTNQGVEKSMQTFTITVKCNWTVFMNSVTTKLNCLGTTNTSLPSHSILKTKLNFKQTNH